MESLPQPPERLSFGKVSLCFVHVVPDDTKRGLVPFYHYRICISDSLGTGHLNFRVGDTEHVRLYAGHIGYEIYQAFRGHGYALQACHAITLFVRSIYPAVILTSDPDNLASIRTIEKLGANFMDEVAVPPHDPHYQRGSRFKKRYQWTP